MNDDMKCLVCSLNGICGETSYVLMSNPSLVWKKWTFLMMMLKMYVENFTKSIKSIMLNSCKLMLNFCKFMLNMCVFSVCPEQCGNGTCYMQLDERKTFWQFILCCHEECLGGCFGATDAQCYSCAHFMHKGRCLPNCPPGTYEVCLSIG